MVNLFHSEVQGEAPTNYGGRLGRTRLSVHPYMSPSQKSPLAAGGKVENDLRGEKNIEIGYNDDMESRPHYEGFKHPGKYYGPILSSDSYEPSQQEFITPDDSRRLLHIPVDRIRRGHPGKKKKKSTERTQKTAARIYKNLESQLKRDGAKSIYKTLKGHKKSLLEQTKKLKEGLKYNSQVKATINRVKIAIKTTKKFIKDKGL